MNGLFVLQGRLSVIPAVVEVLGERRACANHACCQRQLNGPGMQCLPVMAEANEFIRSQRPGSGGDKESIVVAVQFISRNGVPAHLKMDSDLMLSAGDGLCLDQSPSHAPSTHLKVLAGEPPHFTRTPLCSSKPSGVSTTH